MKYSVKENQIVLSVAAVLALYDFFTLPFHSFFVASVFAFVLYYISKSVFIVAFVYFVPQLIQITNVVLGKKEGMTDSTKNITERIKTMKSKYSQGENLNPETPTKEYFVDAKEVSERNIDLRKKNKLPQVEEVLGVVDITMPSGTYPIQGEPSYPGFMKEGFMGTELNAPERIETVAEESVKPVGTFETNPRPSNVVEAYDDESINTALTRNVNSSLSPSNMKSVDMTM